MAAFSGGGAPRLQTLLLEKNALADEVADVIVTALQRGALPALREVHIKDTGVGPGAVAQVRNRLSIWRNGALLV